MSNLMNPTEGWYDGHLAECSYEHDDNGNSYIELQYNIGDQHFYAKERIYVNNKTSGNPQVDEERKERTKKNVERLCEAFPMATANGKLQLVALTNASAEIKAHPIRVKIYINNKGYPTAAAYAVKNSKPKLSASEVRKAMLQDARTLASLGIVIGEESAPVGEGGEAQSPSIADDIPF